MFQLERSVHFQDRFKCSPGPVIGRSLALPRRFTGSSRPAFFVNSVGWWGLGCGGCWGFLRAGGVVVLGLVGSDLVVGGCALLVGVQG